MLWHTARQTVYLACLPSHVLCAYCNFESKQANSITLFGRGPNKKESLNTARKWEWRARIISEVGFLRESGLGKNQMSVVRINECPWVRIKCLLSALTNVHAVSIYQNLSETSMERSIEWRMCSIWHKFHSFMLSSPKFKLVAQISPWIAWNCRWFLVKTREWNMLFHRKFSNGKTGLPF